MSRRALALEVFAELRNHRDGVTAGGMCHLLRDMDLPPLFEEAQNALEFIKAQGWAKSFEDRQFGTVYVYHAKEPRQF